MKSLIATILIQIVYNYCDIFLFYLAYIVLPHLDNNPGQL